MKFKFKKHNIFGHTELIGQNDIRLIQSGNRFHIFMNDTIPDWDIGFSSIDEAETFLNQHDWEHANPNIISEMDIRKDIELFANIYNLKQLSKDKYEKELEPLNKIELSFVVNDFEFALVIKTNQHVETFDDLEDACAYMDNLMRFHEISIFDIEANDSSISNHISILASISTRDLTKNLVRVRSSNLWAYCINIKKAGDKSGDVIVQFKGPKGGPGDIYQLFGVPLAVWHKMLSAPSKGHAYWQYLRGKYPYKKLTGDKKTKMKGGL